MIVDFRVQTVLSRFSACRRPVSFGLHARLVVARASAHNCDARHGAAQVEEQLKRLASEAEAQKKAEAEQAAKVLRTFLFVLTSLCTVRDASARCTFVLA